MSANFFEKTNKNIVTPAGVPTTTPAEMLDHIKSLNPSCVVVMAKFEDNGDKDSFATAAAGGLADTITTVRACLPELSQQINEAKRQSAELDKAEKGGANGGKH